MKRHQRSYAIQSSEFLRQFVLYEDAALGRPEVGASLELLVERLVNYPDLWPLVYRHTDHVRYVVQMAFRKTLRSV